MCVFLDNKPSIFLCYKWNFIIYLIGWKTFSWLWFFIIAYVLWIQLYFALEDLEEGVTICGDLLLHSSWILAFWIETSSVTWNWYPWNWRMCLSRLDSLRMLSGKIRIPWYHHKLSFSFLALLTLLQFDFCNSSNIITTAWKVTVFGVILVRIFPYSDWIQRDALYVSVFSLNTGKCGQNNSEYGQFLSSTHWLV